MSNFLKHPVTQNIVNASINVMHSFKGVGRQVRHVVKDIKGKNIQSNEKRKII